MLQTQPFLDEILENPDDDAPRLVYADWLEERGDPRGEFIRVQCDLAQLPPEDPRRRKLRTRERQLLREHDEEWAGKVSRYAEAWTFHRGMLEEATVSAPEFLRHADDLAAQPEVHSIKLTEVAGRVAELRRTLAFRRLRGLDLSESVLFSRTDVEELAETPFVGLRKLGLARCSISATTLMRLAAAPGLTNLRHLDLSDNPIGDDGAQVIAGAEGWNKLEILRLRASNWHVAYPSCSHAIGASALARSPVLANLVLLDLSGNSVGDAGAIAISESPHLARLAVLNLRGNNIGGIAESGVQALVGSRNLPALRTLDLGENEMEAWAARALAENFRLPHLQDLDLGGCLSTAGVRAIAAARSLRNLRSLGLRGNFLRDDSAYALSGSPHLGRLSRLDLRDNELSYAGRCHLQERFGRRVVLDGDGPGEVELY